MVQPILISDTMGYRKNEKAAVAERCFIYGSNINKIAEFTFGLVGTLFALLIRAERSSHNIKN